MRRTSPWRNYRSALPGTMLLAALLLAPPAGAATVTWAAKGPFEACLESNLETWLGTQAVREVNEETSIKPLDDAEVAKWAASVLVMCAEQRSTANPASEDLFVKYMARWREHIYDRAVEIRRRGISD